MRPALAGLISHKHTTRPLCTLSGPTKRAEPDSKMVTECAKCAPASRSARAPAMFARFADSAPRAMPPPHGRHIAKRHRDITSIATKLSVVTTVTSLIRANFRGNAMARIACAEAQTLRSRGVPTAALASWILADPRSTYAVPTAMTAPATGRRDQGRPAGRFRAATLLPSLGRLHVRLFPDPMAHRPSRGGSVRAGRSPCRTVPR